MGELQYTFTVTCFYLRISKRQLCMWHEGHDTIQAMMWHVIVCCICMWEQTNKRFVSLTLWLADMLSACSTWICKLWETLGIHFAISLAFSLPQSIFKCIYGTPSAVCYISEKNNAVAKTRTSQKVGDWGNHFSWKPPWGSSIKLAPKLIWMPDIR
jgi:hypothetical protein